MGHFVDTIQETAMPSTFSLHIVDGAGCEWMGPGVYGERGQSRESGTESPGVYGGARSKQEKWSGVDEKESGTDENEVGADQNESWGG